MKAAYFEEHGGPEVIKYGDLPDPVAAPGEVVVDIHAASVNGADWKIRLDDAEGLSFKLGLEHEYETDVEDGDERNDLYYYGAVVLDF